MTMDAFAENEGHATGIEERLAFLKQQYSNDPDFTVLPFRIAKQTRAVGVYFSTLTDPVIIRSMLLKPLCRGVVWNAKPKEGLPTRLRG